MNSDKNHSIFTGEKFVVWNFDIGKTEVSMQSKLLEACPVILVAIAFRNT